MSAIVMERQSKHKVKVLAILVRHEQELADVVEEIRQKVIIPYCRRHNCHFLSGMGTYAFVNQTSKVIDDRKIPKKILDLLQINVNGFDLGTQIGDYKGE